MIPLNVDAQISNPASGQFSSEAGQALTFNPAFLIGSGSLSATPTADANSSPIAAPFQSDPSVLEKGNGTAALGATPSPAALPGVTAAAGSDPTLLWLLLGGGILFALMAPSHSGGRH